MDQFFLQRKISTRVYFILLKSLRPFFDLKLCYQLFFLILVLFVNVTTVTSNLEFQLQLLCQILFFNYNWYVKSCFSVITVMSNLFFSYNFYVQSFYQLQLLCQIFFQLQLLCQIQSSLELNNVSWIIQFLRCKQFYLFSFSEELAFYHAAYLQFFGLLT